MTVETITKKNVVLIPERDPREMNVFIWPNGQGLDYVYHGSHPEQLGYQPFEQLKVGIYGNKRNNEYLLAIESRSDAVDTTYHFDIELDEIRKHIPVITEALKDRPKVLSIFRKTIKIYLTALKHKHQATYNEALHDLYR